MKRYLIILLTFFMGSHLYAGVFDSLSIGLCGGYDSYKTFRGEIYLNSEIRIFKLKSEIKAGISNRSYDLEFDNIQNLNAQSICLFGDFVIYPFNKGLFTGIRWEFINFNWLTPESKSTIENEREYSPTSLYTGTCAFFQIGYNFRLSDKIGLKLYGQPGVQQFKISNGSMSSGSYGQVNSTDDLIFENHVEFIYNINLSIEFRIK
jgi:hypothetical protein